MQTLTRETLSTIRSVDLADARVVAADRSPTLWGLAPARLHDRCWASRGIYVVRQGAAEFVDRHAELYLLTDPRTLAIFRVRGLLETLSWVQPDVMVVRLRNVRKNRYRESVVTDAAGGFVQFRRHYGDFESRLARVAVTRSPAVAELWRGAPDARSAWRRLRRDIPRHQWEVKTVTGRTYDDSLDEERALFVRDLVQFWRYPGAVIPGVTELAPGVWGYAGGLVEGVDDRVAGSVWVGAGRRLEAHDSVLGPAVLWDDPSSRDAAAPTTGQLDWDEIEPTERVTVPACPAPRRPASLYQASKRVFDIAFSLVVLLLVAPLFPLVMLAIWLEDGRPFFFAHRRETLGGRTFPCLKFRSMRNDAERVLARLKQQNQADGPQFFMAHDPRLTRIGRLIRKLNVDELPQFLNVLAGHMSVVGPRPSPRRENQFCPAWREARLSVRPGVTGLWQVSRTRRKGLDFQEWIRFDLEYVERAGWALDLRILYRTIRMVLGAGV